MDCPGIDRLIDLQVEADKTPELEAHLRECPACQADLHVVQRLTSAYQREIEVPERLIQQVLVELPGARSPLRAIQAPYAQPLIAGLLGSVTAIAVALGVQTGGDWTLSGLFLFAFGIGTVSAIFQAAEGALRTKPAT